MITLSPKKKSEFLNKNNVRDILKQSLGYGYIRKIKIQVATMNKKPEAPDSSFNES